MLHGKDHFLIYSLLKQTIKSRPLGFPCGSADTEATYNVGDLGSIPGLGRSSGEGKHYLSQYSDLENSIDCIVHMVINSQT